MACAPQHALAHRTYVCAACALRVRCSCPLRIHRRPTWPRLLLRRTARSPRLASTTCWRVSATACEKEPPNNTRQGTQPALPGRRVVWPYARPSYCTVSIGATPRGLPTHASEISETEELAYEPFLVSTDRTGCSVHATARAPPAQVWDRVGHRVVRGPHLQWGPAGDQAGGPRGGAQ